MQYPEYSLLLHHSPNGGWRRVEEARKFKLMGVRAGFPDIVLLLPTEDNTLLALELKVGKNRQQETQKAWQAKAESVGVRYVVIRSFDEFYAEVTQHINKFLDYDRRKNSI